MLIERSGNNAEELVLIHGWGMDRHCWRHLLPEFHKHYRTICVDLPGHGDGCKSSFSFFKLDALIKELASLPTHRATWIGWSLGGFLAQKVAQAYPAKVKRLICVAAAASLLQRTGWPEGLAGRIFQSFICDFHDDSKMAMRRFLIAQVLNSETAHETLEILKLLAVKNYDYFELKKALKLLQQQDMRAAVAQYDFPLLFTGGEADQLVSAANLQASARLAPQAQAWTFEGAAHAPMISHHKLFTAAIMDYLHSSDGR